MVVFFFKKKIRQVIIDFNRALKNAREAEKVSLLKLGIYLRLLGRKSRFFTRRYIQTSKRGMNSTSISSLGGRWNQEPFLCFIFSIYIYI